MYKILNIMKISKIMLTAVKYRKKFIKHLNIIAIVILKIVYLYLCIFFFVAHRKIQSYTIGTILFRTYE